MRQVAIIVGVTLAACSYKPGSYEYRSRPFVGQRMTVGCLDVAIVRHPDIDSAVVLAYQFGNRCDRPAVVDLASVTVVGRPTTGGKLTLRPFDPKGELAVLHLDGRDLGAEAIAYPAPASLGQLCVDVASIAQLQPAQWLCLGAAPLAMVTP